MQQVIPFLNIDPDIDKNYKQIDKITHLQKSRKINLIEWLMKWLVSYFEC